MSLGFFHTVKVTGFNLVWTSLTFIIWTKNAETYCTSRYFILKRKKEMNKTIFFLSILLFLKLYLYIIPFQTLRGLEIKRANEQEQEIERKRRRMLFDPGDFRSLNISNKKRTRSSPTRGFTDIHESIRWRIRGGGKNSKVQQGHRKAVNNAIKHVHVHPHTLAHTQRQDHLVLDTSSVEINWWCVAVFSAQRWCSVWRERWRRGGGYFWWSYESVHLLGRYER